MSERKLIHFLLVEDDLNHAELVRRNLQRERIQNALDHVHDGEQAIQFLNKEGDYALCQTPDVILLDLKLPKVNGFEVLKHVKDNPKLRHIPVVVLTTSDANIDRKQAYDLHVNSFLTKPIDFGQFRQLVRDLSLYWGVWNQPPRQQ